MSVRIITGDCRDVLRTLPDNSVDAVVTDPPYGLSFMGKRWDYDVPSEEVWRECLRVLKPGGHLLAFAGTRTQHRMAVRIEDAGFEIRDMIAWVYSTGFPKSLNLDRAATDHICICDGRAKQKAERDLRPVRDADVPQAIHNGAELGEVLQQIVPQQGASAGKVQRSAPTERPCELGMEGWRDLEATERELQGRPVCESPGVGAADGASGRLHHGAPACYGANVRLPADADGSGGPFGPQPIEQRSDELGAVPHERGSQARGSWPVCAGCGKPMVPKGLGTALKPALEPITVARKPMSGTVAENVLRYGTGGLNIDGCRVEPTGESRERVGEPSQERRYTEAGGTNFAATPGIRGGDPAGRWPANLIHDGSEEVLASFPSQAGAAAPVRGTEPSAASVGRVTGERERVAGAFHADTGSAARFFYCAKATRAERNAGLDGMPARDLNWSSGTQSPGTFQSKGTNRSAQNHHPTVKPLDLMQYLCRLVTPPGGTVLDPFCGSGSTLIAADREGFHAIGIEIDPVYADIARRRIHGDAPLFAQVTP